MLRDSLNVSTNEKCAKAGGGLNLELWTNRGEGYLVLEEGDELVVFVRVNRPCYLLFMRP